MSLKFKYCLKSTILIIICTVFSVQAWSDDSNIDTDITSWIQSEENAFKDWCKQEPAETFKVFARTFKKSKEIRSNLCSKKVLDLKTLVGQINELLLDLDILFIDKFISHKLWSHQRNLFKNTKTLSQFEILEIEGKKEFNILLSENDSDTIKIQGAQLDGCDKRAAKFKDGATCISAMNEFEEAYNFAQSTYAQPIAMKVLKHLTILGKKWDRYFEESKSQTLLEMVINGQRFQQENREHEFKDPPDWQVVFFHPNIVIENVEDAIDGDQISEAIMVEVLGADWWSQDIWFLPSGFSAVALYSDRSEISDWSYGVNINFDSKFMLGFTHHEGDENGVFISIDLLKIIQDKKSMLKEYRDKITF
jgi:hypothetical protein